MELTGRSPTIIQNSSNPSSRKKLDVQLYNCMTVRPYTHTPVRLYARTPVPGATFNMRGQLYCGHTNTTAFFSSPVVSVLGSELDNPGSSSPGRGKVLC